MVSVWMGTLAVNELMDLLFCLCWCQQTWKIEKTPIANGKACNK